MFSLSKENITQYLKTKIDFLDDTKPLQIETIGEGDPEEDGDGFVNFVFRVTDGTHPIIVKQSRSQGRFVKDFVFPVSRNKLEYDTMKLRKAIVPEYIPDLYYIDHENNIFITEDVSYLRIMRFQLNKSIQFHNFAKHCARYMAATNFYTSEYYLDTATFRSLTIRFMNDGMRTIMDDGIFITKQTPEQTYGMDLDEDFARFSYRIISDPEVILSRYKLRHLFLTKGECLIHGDFHTSNIFLGEDDMKVIDMEYTFCGPISYDLGYLINNFISQYAAAAFRSFPTEKERREYQSYILATIKALYINFCDDFISFWKKDAKEIYQDIPGLHKDFRKTTLQECIGFAASANMSRCAGAIPFPDYDAIENPVQKHNAICLSFIIERQLLTHFEQYETIDQVIDDMIQIEMIYKQNIKEI